MALKQFWAYPRLTKQTVLSFKSTLSIKLGSPKQHHACNHFNKIWFAFSKLPNDKLIQALNMIVIKPWHREIKSLSQHVKQNVPFSFGYLMFVQCIISGLAPQNVKKFYFEQFSEQGYLSFSVMWINDSYKNIMFFQSVLEL